MMAVIRNDPALSEMHGGGPPSLFVLSEFDRDTTFVQQFSQVEVRTFFAISWRTTRLE
jgi:hypothetical protein